MADAQDRAVEGRQRLLQRLARVDVQMIRLWNPTGTRFAVSVVDRPAPDSRSVRNSPVSISIFDASGTYLSKVPGTEAVWVLAWLPEGIVALGSSEDGTTELSLVSEAGGSPQVLYRTREQNFRLAAVVSP